MPYRAPELFTVNSRVNIDERTDVWVSHDLTSFIKYRFILLYAIDEDLKNWYTYNETNKFGKLEDAVLWNPKISIAFWEKSQIKIPHITVPYWPLYWIHSLFFIFQSLGCLLYALCFYHSPYDAVYERGDSVALAVQSGSKSVRFPGNSTFSSGLRDLIILMLNAEFRDRPFLAEIISRIQILMEVNEERLWYLWLQECERIFYSISTIAFSYFDSNRMYVPGKHFLLHTPT